MGAPDRYELHDLLGQGGMGAVYRARDLHTSETVAVKLLHLQSAKARERMLREIRALAALNHRGIVRVRDAGSHEGSPFVVLDFVEGETLSERVRREGPLTSFAAAELGRDLAEALAHAHAQGIVHRDVKPDNVLLDARGQPRLTDFGLASQADSEQQRLTQSGALLGTPGYLSPEQAEGKRAEIGPASDVYGLGTVLYFALTGHPPVEGASLQEVVSATCLRPPLPLQEHNPDVDRELAKLVLRALAKAPAKRGTADELAERLEAFLHGPARRSPPWVAGLAIAAVGVLAVGGGWLLGTLNSSEPLSPAAVDDDEPNLVDDDAVGTPPTGERSADERPAPGDTPRVLELCGRISAHLDAQELEPARRLAEEASREFPEASRAWFFRGIVEIATQQPERALVYLARAEELAPERTSITFNQLTCLNHLGRHEEALGLVDRALLKRDQGQLRIQRACTHFYLDNRELAVADLRQALVMPLKPEDLFNAVRACRGEGVPDLLQDYMDQLEASPLELLPHRLSRAELLAFDRPEVVLRDTQEVLRAFPGHPAAILYEAQALFALSRFSEALARSREVPEGSANHASALELRGLVHYARGEGEQALDAFAQQAQLAALSPLAKIRTVLTLVHLGRVDEAQAQLRAFGPPEPIAVALSAVIANARGEPDAVGPLAARAVELGVRQPWLESAIAESLERVGKHDRALGFWRRVVEAHVVYRSVRAKAEERVAALEGR